MPRQDDRIERLAVSLRGLGQRVSFLFLITLALALLVVGRAETYLAERARIVVTDAVAPIMDVLSRPLQSIDRAAGRVADYFEVYEENERLRQEVERLMAWQSVARQLEQLNEEYRDLLNMRVDPTVTYVSARVIADSGGPFVRTVIVNAGARDGARDGQAVITGDGLAGRLVAVGNRAGRVLLLTDLNSRVPVVVAESRYRGILAGDNTARPVLEFLPAGVGVSAGDRIYTSGHGGLFPPGLPVGVVSSMDSDRIRVQPLVDFDRLEFVRILEYETVREIKAAPTAADPALRPDEGEMSKRDVAEMPQTIGAGRE